MSQIQECPSPPGQPPGIWHELSLGGREFDICIGPGTPGIWHHEKNVATPCVSQ